MEKQVCIVEELKGDRKYYKKFESRFRMSLTIYKSKKIRVV